jgi:hypothetical protein
MALSDGDRKNARFVVDAILSLVVTSFNSLESKEIDHDRIGTRTCTHTRLSASAGA